MTQIGKYPDSVYRVSLKAFVRDDEGRILVCKEGTENNWSLPGGGREHDETDQECLKRELYEELGYTDNIDFRPITTKVFYSPIQDIQILWIVYEVQLDGIVDTVGEHTTAITYIDPEEFKDSEFGTAKQAQAAIYEIYQSLS